MHLQTLFSGYSLVKAWLQISIIFNLLSSFAKKFADARLEEAASESCVNVVTCTDAQSVGFMADGASRCFVGMNSTIGACLLDSVDAFSLPVLSGVGEAWQDGVPLLLLVLSPGLEDGSIGPLTEFSKKVFVGGQSLAATLLEASKLAASPPCAPVTVLLPRNEFLTSSRHTRADCARGPSLVECSGPAALFQPQIPKPLKAPRLPLKDPAPFSPKAGAEKAVELLLSAHRPWIHVGMGCANQASGDKGLVQRLAESLEAPVSSTFSGKGVVREDHPLWLWPIAGPAMPNQLREVADTCDTILILGAQMGEIASCRRQWPTRRNTVIHIDADPCVLGANFLPDLPVLGDATEVLELMLSELACRGVEPNERPNSQYGRPHDQTLRGELKNAHELLRAQMRAEAIELPLVDQCPLL